MRYSCFSQDDVSGWGLPLVIHLGSVRLRSETGCVGRKLLDRTVTHIAI